jgi:acetyl/propionyl-CoA carboxylase alpha subunit
MAEKVIIPNRGVIALDIINSLNSIGLETILLHSPEDSLTLPVKLADKSFKFFSSRLEDSYMDQDAIIEKAVELKADYIHPGYGFLAETPEFVRECQNHNIRFIGPDFEALKIVKDKTRLKKMANELRIKTLKHSAPMLTPLDVESVDDEFKFPVIIKPVGGLGGMGIKVADYRTEAIGLISEMLKRGEKQKEGFFVEEFLPFAHHIEIPFFRDIKGNILFLPEIESSIQRRFQKIFQESPSLNVSADLRQSLYEDSKKIIEHINYMGLGYIEFIVETDRAYFSEINPTFQINTLIPEIHINANFIKKQFAVARGELLHDVEGMKIVEPTHHVLLVSLMAENPFDRFRPSAGTVTEFFYYSAIRNLFKTAIYGGARISSLYDPYIGKIVTYAVKRENAIKDMRTFLDNINIRGIQTNLIFLKHLLESEWLHRGETINDFLNLKCDFTRRHKKDEELQLAAALLAAAFHVDNRKKNYRARLEKMKQPGLLRRLFRGV